MTIINTFNPASQTSSIQKAQKRISHSLISQSKNKLTYGAIDVFIGNNAQVVNQQTHVFGFLSESAKDTRVITLEGDFLYKESSYTHAGLHLSEQDLIEFNRQTQAEEDWKQQHPKEKTDVQKIVAKTFIETALEKDENVTVV